MTDKKQTIKAMYEASETVFNSYGSGLDQMAAAYEVAKVAIRDEVLEAAADKFKGRAMRHALAHRHEAADMCVQVAEILRAMKGPEK